jgi:hypothetical protein
MDTDIDGLTQIFIKCIYRPLNFGARFSAKSFDTSNVIAAPAAPRLTPNRSIIRTFPTRKPTASVTRGVKTRYNAAFARLFRENICSANSILSDRGLVSFLIVLCRDENNHALPTGASATNGIANGGEFGLCTPEVVKVSIKP